MFFVDVFLFVNLVFFYISYLSTPFCLNSQSFLSSATIVRVGNDCTGYLFPETNYIWTLSHCLEYENDQGNNPLKSRITIQKNHSAVSTSGLKNSIIEIDTIQTPTKVGEWKNTPHLHTKERVAKGNTVLRRCPIDISHQ